MSKTLGERAVGDLVCIKENGVKANYIVVHQGTPSSSLYRNAEGGTWLLREDIMEKRIWRETYDNYYGDAPIRFYLEDTFRYTLEDNVRNALKYVQVPWGLHTAEWTHQGYLQVFSGDEGMHSYVFLLSIYEVGGTNEDNLPDGSMLSYFTSGSTTAALNKRIGKYSNTALTWWLRSPYTDTNKTKETTATVTQNGYIGQLWPDNVVGVRPAFVLPNTFELPSPNSAPTTPSSITVPSSIKAGETISISWGKSTDEDGDLEGYVLERSTNNGSTWSQIYKGGNTSTTNTIASGTTTVKYRVKAYDSEGEESDYRTSSTVTLTTNSAPTTPSSISVPSTIKGGDTVTISWGTATDEDGNLEGYVLERSTNGGTSWTEIYNGPSTSTTNLVTYGLTSVIYRVKAYDSEGAESEYQSSSLVSVINNTAPKISGSDGNLGTKVFAFLQSYTVTDDEGGTVTVVEKVDGVTTKSYTVTLGNSNVFSFTDSQWQKLSNGSHSMTVTATDSYGASVTRTYTFTKSETEIELTYHTAMTATTMPTVGVYYITKEIPSGASFSVRVCNNGFDSSPTWEDVTAAVNNGGRFYFNNTSKTASKWGVNAEIKVSRNNSSGDCYISSVRGYFK